MNDHYNQTLHVIGSPTFCRSWTSKGHQFDTKTQKHWGDYKA